MYVGAPESKRVAKQNALCRRLRNELRKRFPAITFSARKGDCSVVANDVGIVQISCPSATSHTAKFNDDGLRCCELTRDQVSPAMDEAPEGGGSREMFRI